MHDAGRKRLGHDLAKAFEGLFPLAALRVNVAASEQHVNLVRLLAQHLVRKLERCLVMLGRMHMRVTGDQVHVQLPLHRHQSGPKRDFSIDHKLTCLIQNV